jgi:hypothetical protein
MNHPFAKKSYSVGRAIGVILTHLAVSLVHGYAHERLEIGLAQVQRVFIGIVIVAAPLVAGYFLWRGNRRTGGALTAASMAGALLFGLFFHFVHEGPDNVWRLLRVMPPGWYSVFETTAFLLAVLELWGVVLGLRLAKKLPD